MKVKRLRENAKLPTYGSDGAAGLDLYTDKDVVVEPGEIKVATTGISLEIPSGMVGDIRPRSGFATKYGITVINSPGTIDEDYRGEIMVSLVNHGKTSFHIPSGTRVAQLVVLNYNRVELEEVVELTETERGEGRHGSTGEK